MPRANDVTERHVILSPGRRDLPPGLSLEEFARELEVAASRWSGVCPGLSVGVGEPVDRWSVREDGFNLFAFRTESWCFNYTCNREGTYPLGTAGMTTTFPADSSGTFGNSREGVVPREADVEINARFVGFSLTAPRPEEAKQLTSPQVETGRVTSLQSVLVHEMGHVLGLPDRCGISHLSMDHEGECPADSQESVMYAPASHEEPTPSDVAELCSLLKTSVPRELEMQPHPVSAEVDGTPSAPYVWMLVVAIVAFGAFWVRVKNRE